MFQLSRRQMLREKAEGFGDMGVDECPSVGLAVVRVKYVLDATLAQRQIELLISRT